LLRKVILIDGDKVRKYISIDLGYSLKERKTQVNRVLGICKIIIESGFFPVASTVYLDEKILKKR
jgi:adenylylsulfate kinase-like enzyme